MNLSDILILIAVFVLTMLLLKSRKKELPTPEIPIIRISRSRNWLDRYIGG